MALVAIPSPPTCEFLRDAFEVLRRAGDAAQSFFNAFATVRNARGAKGAPTDHEQDLLRASLVFAAAGLDAMVKQLVRDCLAVVVDSDKGAQTMFAEHVQSRLQRKDSLDARFLARALVSKDSRGQLLDGLIYDLTANSLQSKDQLLRVAAHFAIGADELTTDVIALKEAFDMRNQIAHEMDIKFGQVNRSRRSRSLNVMKRNTSLVLRTARAFYIAVEKRIDAAG